MSDSAPPSPGVVITYDVPAQAVVNIQSVEDNEQSDGGDEDQENQPMDISTSPPALPKLESNTTQTTPGLIRNGPPSLDEKEKSHKVDEGESDDEGQTCPICFEVWTNAGDHRLASLQCGHLFGKSCISRWLKDPKNKFCPQCKKRAKTQDIRVHYATSLKVLDTSEKEEIKMKVKTEKLKREHAEEQQGKAELQITLMKREMEKLKKQVEDANMKAALAESRTQNTSNSTRNHSPSKLPTNSQSSQSSQNSQAAGFPLSTTNSLPKLTKRYTHKKSLNVATKDARVLAFDKHSMIMVVSKPSPNQLFPGHGVFKVSSLEARSSEYIPIHSSCVRDAKFNHTGDNLLLTASTDKTMKITNVLDRSTVLSYTCPKPVWACAWNECDTNYVYAGIQHGGCYVFDIRNLEKEICELRPRAGIGHPIVSMSYVPPKDDNNVSSLNCEGLLIGTLQGGWFVKKEADDSYTEHPMLLPGGSCMGMCFEPRTRHGLITQRPLKRPRTIHSLLELAGDGTPEVPLHANVVKQGFAGNVSTALTRSVVYTTPEDHSRIMFASGDEASSSVFVWDGLRGDELQKLSSNGGTILDVLAFEAYESQFLATLTGQKLDFYQWG